MEGATTAARRHTGFSDLPAELTGMILGHLISDIETDHPRDLRRWRRGKVKPPAILDALLRNPLAPSIVETFCHVRQLYNQVKISIRPHLHGRSQLQAGNITVMVPRKWKELLQSGLFRDCDLSWFGRNMAIEVDYLATRHIKYTVSRGDTRIEAAVRALLVRVEEIKVRDLRLHAVHFSPASLACYLPRLKCLEIVREGVTPWPRSDPRPTLSEALDLHVITEEEAHNLQSTGLLPMGLVKHLDARDAALEIFRKRFPDAALSVKTIRKRVQHARWTGKTTHVVRLYCIVQGSVDWSNHRIACLALILDINQQYRWDFVGAGINSDVGQVFGVNTWASRLHLNL